MEIATLVELLDDPSRAEVTLRSWGLNDRPQAGRRLQLLAEGCLTLDLLAVLCRQAGPLLPSTGDPDRVLDNLVRFISAARNPLALGGLFERDPEALETLLRIFSAGQGLSEQLIDDPEAFDLVRMTDGQPSPREALLSDVVAETASYHDERSQAAAISRIHRRETLRIAYGEIVRGQEVDVVSRQLSYLADALLAAAVQCADRKYGEMKKGDAKKGPPLRWSVLSLGKLGACEMDYGDELELLFVSDSPVESKRSTLHDAADRMAKYVVRLLSDDAAGPAAYRVKVRRTASDGEGSITANLEDVLHHYDVEGRTHERQALMKARHSAGDETLAKTLLRQLEPWIYQRYLSQADEAGMAALKRRILERSDVESVDQRDLKLRRGGLLDIKNAVQFLQLLNAGDRPALRVGNTSEALARLQETGSLTLEESKTLADGYRALRRVEHRLQIMFETDSSRLPEDRESLTRLAMRVYETSSATAERLESDVARHADAAREVIERLLNSAFANVPAASPETELILDPEPASATIDRVLAPYAFRDPGEAYAQLTSLASEHVPFLSTRNCRYFLSEIAPQLLEAIADTPDADYTLANLARVSDSLGGKGVLWDLIRVHPPTLRLYVQLCAACPYLSNILVSNPGMIDELLDGLLLERRPSLEALLGVLAELRRGATDLSAVLFGFKNAQHLRVGVRDILDKDDVAAVHGSLADIMEAILLTVAEREYARLAERYGRPIIAEGPRQGEPCELIVIALGKFGGREPNYHSDCDVAFLYEGEGTTHPLGRKTKEITTNAHFFAQLAQRIVKELSQFGPHGRLFDVDATARLTGRGGPQAVSLADFSRYFEEGSAGIVECLSLCKARPITGSPMVQVKARHAIQQAMLAVPWRQEFAESMRDMRRELERGASPENLKRAPGGTLDVEFAVQRLQLEHAANHPEVLAQGTLEAAAQLRKAGWLSHDDATGWSEAYSYLRRIESALRLMNTTARHDLPTDPAELKRLAYLIGTTPEKLLADCEYFLRENRRRFDRLFPAETTTSDEG